MALFVLPRASAYGQNVISFPGAKLYFYEAGTLTAKTTYSDPGLTVANADPVVADANGVFDAIFLTGSYKVILKDSADVTIWTEDDLTARDGDVTYQGTFDSTTNAGDFPSTGNSGDKYLVTETFKLNAASGSKWVFTDDFIFCNKDGATGIAADWEIELGVQSRPVVADWSAKGLIINVDGNTSASVEADYINLLNDANEVTQISAVDDVYDIETDIMSGSTESASTWYELWIDEDKKLLMVPDLTGAASATVSTLRSDAAAFITQGVTAGDLVYNTSSGTSTTVTSATSETTLSLADDIFTVANNNYLVRILSPTGLGDFKANIGKVYNNAAGNLTLSEQYGPKRTASAIYSVDNGYGTSSTAILKFSTEIKANNNPDLIFVQNDAALGFVVTANKPCFVTMSYNMDSNGNALFGISKNSTELGTGIATITAADIVVYAHTAAADVQKTVTFSGYLEKGDAIRPHTNISTAGLNAAFTRISVLAVEI